MVDYGVLPVAALPQWFGGEGRRVYDDTISPHAVDKRIVVTKEPVGVCATITPWNFPAAMITRKAGPALAAGCTMVLEPATATRSRHWPSAPAPEGRLFFCHGPSSEIGGEMTSNPIVRKLTFSGLTEVGKLLMEQCAGTVKKLPSELGGNAPLIVFDDADIEIAVKGAIASKSECRPDLRQGQPDFLVQVGVYDAHQPKPPVR